MNVGSGRIAVDIQLGAKVLFIAYALDGQIMGGL